MMFIKKAPNSHGFVNPRDVEEMWRRHRSEPSSPAGPGAKAPSAMPTASSIREAEGEIVK